MKEWLLAVGIALGLSGNASAYDCLDRPDASHVVYVENMTTGNANLATLLEVLHRESISLIPSVAMDGTYYFNLSYQAELQTQDRKATFEEINSLEGIGYYCKPASTIPGAVTGIN